jgi:hypothetical protein
MWKASIEAENRIGHSSPQLLVSSPASRKQSHWDSPFFLDTNHFPSSSLESPSQSVISIRPLHSITNAEKGDIRETLGHPSSTNHHTTLTILLSTFVPHIRDYPRLTASLEFIEY